MWELVLKAAERYLVSHPEVVEKLIEELVQYVVARFEPAK